MTIKRLLTVCLLVTLCASPNAAYAATGPGWGLDRIDQRSLPLDGTFTAPNNGSGVTVYLVDTGLDVGNAAFGGRASLGRNFTNRNPGDCADEMGVGHGTFVAGIVGGATTGVANAVKLVEMQALACSEGGSTMTIAEQRRAVVRAANWIRTHATRPAVVNMSLTFGGSDRVYTAVRRLIRAGIPVVAAAGNQGVDAGRKSPARVPAVITTGASTERDRPWSGSNRGSCVDLWAPGKDITSVLSGGGVFRYRFVGATSWAAPFVTGAVAQFLQTHPQARPARVQRFIKRTATRGPLTNASPNRLLFVG